MNNTLKVSLLNAQSYTNKFAEINDFISTNQIDVMCLNETWLKHDKKTANLLKNYTIIRNDRLTRGGGVAIIIERIKKLTNNHFSKSIHRIYIKAIP